MTDITPFRWIEAYRIVRTADDDDNEPEGGRAMEGQCAVPAVFQESTGQRMVRGESEARDGYSRSTTNSLRNRSPDGDPQKRAKDRTIANGTDKHYRGAGRPVRVEFVVAAHGMGRPLARVEPFPVDCIVAAHPGRRARVASCRQSW
ncbi:hypothetical protein SCUP515_07045 [Seiridium cupressi]